ncbi:MAG: LysM peptidoglycan-binding domain-containing protein [Phaeodactylibacter sp.]|nr:LysM peptidoglycan-binding domain-containing protein [Phaeodactylibacter sp.]MCB9050589.1 LysM peptidoglycan-binding domain-containing protein [Lewinellaceae bacterium]
MRSRKLSSAWLLLFAPILAYGQGAQSHLFYIEQYNGIAVREMIRTGIPASITLAQGILESNAGRSELAVLANNHFGIKCGDVWGGAAYFKKDDDYGPSGYLKESCFRSYPTADASFIDHSSFLASPQKSSRYGPLFRLSPTDYKGWAYGLQQAGYATSTLYASQLISLIERYALFQYDQPGPLTVEAAGQPIPPLLALTNNVPFTLASGYETLQDIAYRTNTSVEDLLKYNEGLPNGYLIPAGQKVFLGRKRKAFRGPVDTHEVQPSESMYEISQRYGVQLDKLLERNRLNPGDQPAEFETIKLRGSKTKEAPLILPYTFPDAQFHTVVTGDTLWNISRRYNTTVEALKQLNELSSDLIKIGMELQVR